MTIKSISNMTLTDEQLIEIYKIVFSKIHSHGFMTCEVKDLLFQPGYWFMEKPNENWYTNLINYLDEIGYDKTNLNINFELI